MRLSTISVPVPDVLIRPNDDLKGVECDDMMIAFEVLSPSTANHDLRWKRKAYATLPVALQYVVIAQDAVEVVSFDRTNDFAERRFESAEAELDLPIIGAGLSLRDIYRGTGSSRPFQFHAIFLTPAPIRKGCVPSMRVLTDSHLNGAGRTCISPGNGGSGCRSLRD